MPDTAMSVLVSSGVESLLTAGVEAEQFSQGFDPVRSYSDVELQLDELAGGELHVDVVASSTGQKMELGSRGAEEHTIPVDVIVRKKFIDTAGTGVIPIADIDALKLLVEEMQSYFTGERMDDFGGAVWQETAIVCSPWLSHLHKFRQFTAVIRLTFTIEKQTTFNQP